MDNRVTLYQDEYKLKEIENYEQNAVKEAKDTIADMMREQRIQHTKTNGKWPSKSSPKRWTGRTEFDLDVDEIESHSEGRLLVKLSRRHATMPRRSTDDAAGFDLFAAEATVVEPGTRQLIATGISVACPKGTYARIAPRSHMSMKRSLDR